MEDSQNRATPQKTKVSLKQVLSKQEQEKSTHFYSIQTEYRIEARKKD